MSFRKIIFWMHLVAGLIAGLSIGVMCFTGTALAFEKQIVAWGERDVRRVTPPTDNAARLPVDELLQRVRAAQPEARPAAIAVSSDPRDAVAFTVGRDGGFYANPYTGEVKAAGGAEKIRAFMATMTAWHRTLALTGENRNLGKQINGACNIAFCVLGISGLYLWWPRAWSKRAVKAIAVMNFKFKGKARDFNWHNSIGLWCAPILIVLTLTALPISYQWGGTFINYVTGTPNPAPGAGGQGGGGGGGPGGAPAPAVEVSKPAEGAKALGYEALIASVQKETPRWELITLRLSNAGGSRGGGGPRAESAGTPASAAGTAGDGRGAQASGEGRGGQRSGPAAGTGEGRRGQRGEGASANGGEMRGGNREAGNNVAGAAGSAGRGIAQAVSFTIRESGTWPRTASTTLTLDPYTGAVLKREGFGDQTLGRQVRSWTRFLHTGEALGPVGQFFAGLACLGGCFLVYTGFALSWRRFFGKKTKPPATAATTAPSASVAN
jgi:uncharacterized iron-regulated membrane protein